MKSSAIASNVELEDVIDITEVLLATVINIDVHNDIVFHDPYYFDF